MFIFDFIPYIIAFSIAVAIPGPGIAACVGKALGSGFRPAFYFMIGLILGDLTYLTFAILGLSAIVSVFSGFFIIIKFAGAAYLLWLAWSFWNAGIDPKNIKYQRGNGFWSSLISGYSITLANPKAIIFYMALLPSIFNIETITLEKYFVLVILTILLIILVITPYILLASKARVFFSNPRSLKILNRGAATAMAGAAFFVILKE